MCPVIPPHCLPPSRYDVVNSARSFVGTRFMHQGRSKALGVDCVGLLLCVAYELNLKAIDFPGYYRVPDGTLEDKLSASLERVFPEDRQGCLHCHMPGDILCFNINKVPRHVAIRTPYGIIHALGDSKKVNETSYDQHWRKRLSSVWEWGTLEDTTLLPAAKPQLVGNPQKKECCNG